jgi:glutamine synthetase
MAGQLAELAREKGIKYFLFNFTDLKGYQRSKLVPASAADGMATDGAGFAGFAAYLDLTPAHPDMFAIPDTDTLIQLPWKPEVAWMAGDLYMDGEPLEQSPRRVLKRQLEQWRANDMVPMSGVEAELHLINTDGSDISDAADVDPKPCYDQQAVMRRYDVVAEVCGYMEALGWQPYQNDHEDSNGQFELNWGFADALTTADRCAFFKFMVKSVAERHGLRATFMPKPFAHLTGNGCHVHFSAWDLERERNVMEHESDELGLAPVAYHVMGGIMDHAQALSALTNPTVNSYKRINAPTTASGATWAPNAVTWSGNNRTHMIRVPDPGRVELRQPDGAANPYLMQAAILAAGLDGIERQTSPGSRSDVNMYAPEAAMDVKHLPLYLLDALRALESDETLCSQLGRTFVSAYLNHKWAEWNDYSRTLTAWERRNTLDC